MGQENPAHGRGDRGLQPSGRPVVSLRRRLVANGERVAAAPAQGYARCMRAVVGTARYWVPLLAGLLCLVAVLFVGAVLGWLLIILAFGLLLDGATAMFERAG